MSVKSPSCLWRRSILGLLIATLTAVACGGEGPSGRSADPSRAAAADSRVIPTVPTSASREVSTVPTIASTTTSTTWPLFPATPSPIDYRHDLSADEIGRFASTISALQRELGDSGPLRVLAYHSLDAFVAAYAEVHPGANRQAVRDRYDNGASAEAGKGFMAFYMPGLSRVVPVRETFETIVAHEYFHTLQGALVGRETGGGPTDRTQPAGPDWLLEGAAHYVGLSFAAGRGVTDLDAYIRKEVAASKRHSAPELRYLETRDQVAQAANPTTGLGSLTVPLIAMQYLQREHGREPLLHEYWRQVPRAADWQTAFATAFGLSVGQFYEQFEAYRATL